ncbi:hypothetical protein F8388_019220 [Cannabis sativa]|uniref:CCHC-type domain-containing protein n=1 Tax=Cannabis sativa TaxID=3483 RepID=A0A7J6F5R3_CANSA|nr:hypothetical protein F8388_019220 [Cannabis sativa]
MAQHNPISAMLHRPDEEFDKNSETCSQDSDTSNESQDSGTSDESKDSDTSDDDVPPYFMAQSAEEAYSQTEPIVKSEDESEEDEEEAATKNTESKHHQKSKYSKFQTFTLDDIPPSKWRERFQEFQAWLSLETQKPQAQTGTILLNFALEKMCSQKKFLQEFMKQSKKLGKVCSRRDLLIKCPSESSCSCKTPKKKKPSSRRSSSRNTRDRDFRKKSDRCFVCGKKGHYAKQCPKGKTVKLISHIQQTTGMSLKENDIESIFSTDDEFNSDSLCAFEQWSDSDTPECYQMSTIHTLQPSPRI